MIKIYNTDIETSKLKKVQDLQIGCWIHLENPTIEEVQEISQKLDIKEEFIMGIMDNDERPRFEEEANCKMLLLDIPIATTKKSKPIITLPLGILLVRDDYIVTVALQKYAIFDVFIEEKVKEFYTYKKSRFVIQLIYQIAVSYLKLLKEIDKKIEMAESKILNATTNEELLHLLALQNSLTYIITALRSNGAVLDKILKGTSIELFDDDAELLQDAMIENHQAIEMADLYRGILSSTTDTVATIISNNLNGIMKFLAGITIVISIPTMVASFMGMNVNLGFFATNPYGFVLLILISLFLSVIIAIVLKIKNML